MPSRFALSITAVFAALALPSPATAADYGGGYDQPEYAEPSEEPAYPPAQGYEPSYGAPAAVFEPRVYMAPPVVVGPPIYYARPVIVQPYPVIRAYPVARPYHRFYRNRRSW